MVLTRSQKLRLEGGESDQIFDTSEGNQSVLTPKPLNQRPEGANLANMKGSARRGVLSHPLGGETLSFKEPRSVKGEEENENRSCKLPDGGEPKVVEVAYPSVSELLPIAEGAVDGFVSDVEAQLKSIEWAVVCSGMNDLRRLAVYHPEKCESVVHDLLPYVVKGIRSPRSALSKSAIITSKDLFRYIPKSMGALVDEGSPSSSLLSQLLLKAASNDKQFVVEEAVASLEQMTSSVDPLCIINCLISYAEHKNPRVRGKIMRLLLMVLEREQNSAPILMEVGLDKIIRTLAHGLTDNTAEARESSRKMTEKVLRMMNEEQALREIVQAEDDSDGSSCIMPYFSKVLGPSKAAIFLKSFDY